MSFQDKYKEYKERQEAKNYFRSNNDQFLNTDQWVKAILGGLIATLGCGVLLGIISYQFNITSLLMYVVCAYVIAHAITYFADLHNQQTAILSAILTFVCFVVGMITLIMIPTYMSGLGYLSLNIGSILSIAIKAVFIDDLFRTIVVIFSVFIAYQQAR